MTAIYMLWDGETALTEYGAFTFKETATEVLRTEKARCPWDFANVKVKGTVLFEGTPLEWVDKQLIKPNHS